MRIPTILWTTDTGLLLTSLAGGDIAADRPDANWRGASLHWLFPDLSTDSELFVAHRQALRGESSTIRAEIQGRALHARVEPLLGTKKEIVGVLGTAHDDTEYQVAERALKLSEESYRGLIERSPFAICQSALSGQLLQVNHTMVEMLGYESEADLLLRNLQADIAEDPSNYDRFISELRRNTALQGFECRWKQQNGNPIDVNMAGRALMDARGEISHLEILAENVTERKRLETELRLRERTNAQLLDAKEAAEATARAKSEFLANMSHEIRTPMNAIIGMTGLLLESKLAADQREFVETIRQGSESLLTIVNDILDFSKIESGKLSLEKQPFSIRQSVEAALDLLATEAARKNIEMAYVIDRDTPTYLMGDVTRVRQILINLLGNAVKFTNEGEVSVAIKARKVKAALYEVQFSVRDTGIGIPKSRMDRLFQSFSQVDTSTTRTHGGTGLGLAISKELVQLMGGRIWVDSEENRGSTFHFTIVAEAAAGPIPLHEQGAIAQLADKRLLIVDDNDMHRRNLSALAETWGLRIVTAASAAKAFEALRSAPFDFVIIESAMLAPDGAEVIAALREAGGPANLSIMAISSIGQFGLERSRELGISAVLSKPVKPSDFHNALMAATGSIAGPPSEPVVESRLDPTLGTRLPLAILFAEDNAVNQRLGLHLLNHMGYRADVAANGREAIEALRRRPYDLILMDVQMPEMDGLEATRRIRQEWLQGGPRIIAMTANAMRDDRDKCLAAGMDDYISKPVHPAQLQSLIARHATEREIEKIPTLDSSAFNELRELEQAGGSPGLVAELVQLFFEDLPDRIEGMREAITKGNADKLQRESHRLKGSSRQMGAARLSALCAELESIGRAGKTASFDEAMRFFLWLERESGPVRQALRANSSPQ